MQIASAEELSARALALASVQAARDAALACGADAYLVGGSVRDLLLGREPLDVDLATAGPALPLAAALSASNPDTSEPGTPDETEFGTVTMTVAGIRYDIARTRGERYERPGALPVVSPAGIDADLSRRDFSVNAAALGLTGPRRGELIALPGALDDLARERLAILHDASFSDDPTRLLRLARYQARLGFQITPRTRQAAADAIQTGALNTISGTRVGNELRLLAAEDDPVAAFASAQALALPWRIDRELAYAALRMLPADGRRGILTLALVFQGTDRGPLTAELDRLGFGARDRDTIVGAATDGPVLARRLLNARSGAQTRQAIGTAGVETVALAAALGAGPAAEDWLDDLRHRRLQITGADLLAHGLGEGPEIGRALDAAADALMDGRADGRDAQLEIALRAAQ